VIKNAKSNPKVYYGLHMVEGVAEYNEPGKEMYRIIVRESAIKNMDPTFEGRPVYVDHVDGVDLEKIQEEADGYVTESFFNQADGKHWCKFIVVSDRGHEAIRNGWKLSNAYIPKSFGSGGLWHGVEYDKEVISGEYEHLAIVRNPRYEESVILTPEQFKEYNGKKELELKRLSNSKKEKKVGLLNLFKKEKIENAADLEQVSVTLPKSKKEMTILEAVAIADAVTNAHGYANGEHLVKCGEEEMSVNEMVEKYGAMKSEMDKAAETKKNSEEEEKKKENEGKEEPKAENEAEEDKPKQNEEEEKKKENTDDKDADDMKPKKNSHFEDLKNAPKVAVNNSGKIELSEDKVARGKSRYGSN